MLFRGENRFCLPRLATFVGSLFGKIEMEKHKYIPTAVLILAGVMYTLVVDSFIAKLRAIFAAVGRQGEWQSSLQLGNPASVLEVKSHLKTFTAEQLQARVTVKQAAPLFLPKLHSLARFLIRKMNSPGISA